LIDCHLGLVFKFLDRWQGIECRSLVRTLYSTRPQFRAPRSTGSPTVVLQSGLVGSFGHISPFIPPGRLHNPPSGLLFFTNFPHVLHTSLCRAVLRAFLATSPRSWGETPRRSTPNFLPGVHFRRFWITKVNPHLIPLSPPF
jgi:hypothetical protein